MERWTKEDQERFKLEILKEYSNKLALENERRKERREEFFEKLIGILIAIVVVVLVVILVINS